MPPDDLKPEVVKVKNVSGLGQDLCFVDHQPGDGRGFLHGEIAGDLAVTGDLFLLNWGGHELTIEDDGHLPPDVGPAKAAHSDSAFAIE